MANELSNKRVAALVDHGFEQSELLEPKKALEAAGATVHVVSPQQGKVKGWQHTDWGEEVAVDVALDSADAAQYDALLLPGGVGNPDTLRTDEDAVGFVRSFVDAGKPVAAICHAPWMLVEADVVRGRKVTSFWSIKTDVRNAGGNWVDEEVVLDGGVVTSRSPDDIPAFNKRVIEEFARTPVRA